MASWNFPSNGDGQIKGPADAGIENFNGTELVSLAREICQNSLDAFESDKKPVIIEFELYKIKNTDVPGYAELKDAMLKCARFWRKQNNIKTANFFDKAVEIMNKNHNTFFRIFEEKKHNLDLSNILDVPILLIEGQGSSGCCYTDLEALKQYYRDMYTNELGDDPESLEAQLEYIDEQSLKSFSNFENYKDWGDNTYLRSIRSTIINNFDEVDIDSNNIVYDEESKMILVPVNNPQDDIESFVEEVKDEWIFGVETCIGDPYGFTYDPDRELISIPADFSNLNAEYPIDPHTGATININMRCI